MKSGVSQIQIASQEQGNTLDEENAQKTIFLWENGSFRNSNLHRKHENPLKTILLEHKNAPAESYSF